MNPTITLDQLINSIKTIMLGYAFDNLKLVTPSNVKIERLHGYFIGHFSYFMCWFVHFCSVNEDFWPDEFNKQTLERAREYVFKQMEELSRFKKPMEYRFVCAYINHIITHSVTCPGKERARSYLRDIIVDAKRKYSVEYDDALQTMINDIVKFNLETNNKIWDLPQFLDTNDEFAFVPRNTKEANSLVKRKRGAQKILSIMNKYVDKMKKKLVFANTIKNIKVESPKRFKYRNSQK